LKRPQIVVFERDGRLARQLDALARDKKWVLRESRQVEPCLRLLAGQGPTVLVMQLPSNADTELALLARVDEVMPHVATVAVGEMDENPALAGLAWDLGADFALFPPVPVSRLPAIVEGLMGHA
jgi:hypothetical protein